MKKGIIRAVTALLCLAAVSVFPCTIFNASKNGLVLAGNNEDLNSTDSRVWFYPPQAGKYGYVYVGFDSYGIQGGMNDRGVFFDFNALKFAKMTPSPEKPGIRSWRGFIDKIMTECATVEQVVELLGRHNLAWWGPYQVMFADATGASAVIGADRNGDLSVIRKKGVYQVSTNFSLANPDFGSIVYPCYRYDIANQMLERMDELTVDYFRKILAAAHQEGANPTIYSNICDLTNKVIYIYNFHNFEDVARLSLAEEFKKGEHSYEILSLFPRKIHAQKAFEEAQAKRLSQVLLQALLEGGTEAAVKKFEEVKADYSLVKGELDSLISSLRIRGRRQDMLEISKLYVREFPNSADGHKRLGDLYQWSAQRELAVESYRKALELDPKNAEVIEILNKIDK
jgi:tetratricopeptide (TPR) repeat protein